MRWVLGARFLACVLVCLRAAVLQTHPGQCTPPLRLTARAAPALQQVAYCLGQRQDPAAVATLKRILKDEREHPMWV